MMTASIIINPVLPLALLAALTGGFSLLLWYSFRKCEVRARQKVILWGLRTAAAILVAFVLCQPALRQSRHIQKPPILVTAIDVSASMKEEVDPDQPPRYERALEYLQSGVHDNVAEKYRTMRYTVANKAERLYKDPDNLIFSASRSRITEGLNQISRDLTGQNVAGIVLLSDGLDESEEELSAAAANIPVFIPALEKEFRKEPEEDIRITNVNYPELLTVDWEAEVTFILRRNQSGERTVPVQFFKNGELKTKKNVHFKKNQRMKETSLSIQPKKTGEHVYKIQINPADDARFTNNRRRFIIEVTQRQNRVLYLEDNRRWEFKFLKRALLAEKRIHLTAFVGSGNNTFLKFDERNTGGSSSDLPELTRRYLSQFRAIILGDIPPQDMSAKAWAELNRFVEKGGGLLLAGGKDALSPEGWAAQNEMRPLLPAVSKEDAHMREGQISVRLRPQTRSHPVIKGLKQDNELPSLLSHWGPVELDSLSSVLLQSEEGSPILITRRYGEGRVAMLLTNTLWRWQLQRRAKGNEGENRVYRRLIVQLVRWLIPEKKEMTETDRFQVVTNSRSVTLREEVKVGAYAGQSMKISSESLVCNISTPEGNEESISLVQAQLGEDFDISGETVNGYKGTYTPTQPGRYTFKASLPDGTQSDKKQVLVKRPYAEKTGQPLAQKRLKKLAGQTGGAFFKWEDKTELREALPYNPTEIQQVSEESVWTHPVILVVLLALFCGEWYLRRRFDLL